MYFLGIDIGSTAVKAAVLRVGVDGKPDGVIGRGSADYPTYYPVSSGVEQSPADWNRATVSAIRSAVSCVDEHERRSISGISFSSQAGSIYPADENNVPLCDALTWMDRRATKEAEDVAAALGADNIRDKCGWPVAPTDCISKLLWLSRNKSEIFGAAKHFYTTQESVTGYLCGNFVTDPTGMVLSRLYDYKKGEYITEALELLGISADKLPTVAPCGSLAGTLLPEVAELCELEAGIPVYVGAHDQYCASLGSGVTENGQLLIATGTAWVIFGVSPSPISNPPYPAPCTHPINGRFGVMKSLAGCGGALGAFAASCGTTPAALDLEIEMEGADNKRAKLSDYFVCPLPPNPAIPHKDGVCVPMSVAEGKTPADTALAAMEGAAFEARALVEAFEAAGFPAGSEIVISGGASKSRLWLEIVAAVFADRKLYRLAEPDAPALGAAMLAATGTGAFGDLTEAATMPRRIFVPADPAVTEYYSKKYQAYRRFALAD